MGSWTQSLTSCNAQHLKTAYREKKKIWKRKERKERMDRGWMEGKTSREKTEEEGPRLESSPFINKTWWALAILLICLPWFNPTSCLQRGRQPGTNQPHKREHRRNSNSEILDKWSGSQRLFIHYTLDCTDLHLLPTQWGHWLFLFNPLYRSCVAMQGFANSSTHTPASSSGPQREMTPHMDD